MIERFLAGSLDGRKTVVGNTAEDGDHLPITVKNALQPPAHFLHRGRENPFPERRTVAQSTGFASQNGDIMPGIVDRLARKQPGCSPTTRWQDRSLAAQDGGGHQSR